MEWVLQTVTHTFEHMGSYFWVRWWSAQAVFGHFRPPFFSEKCRNFCREILPSLAHLNLGGAPSEPPHTTSEAHFSVCQDFLWQAVKKKEKRGKERTPRKLDQPKITWVLFDWAAFNSTQLKSTTLSGLLRSDCSCLCVWLCVSRLSTCATRYRSSHCLMEFFWRALLPPFH